MASYVDTAVEAARAGAAVLMRRLGRIDEAHISEKARNDLVTAVDRESEAAVVACLRGRFPRHAVLAEESAGGGESRSAAAGWRWVVDPLDGTTNYIHGYPCFCVSVGLERDGRPVAGCVLDPVRNETFTAEEGGGAFLDGRRIRVSGTSELRQSLLVTGFPFRAVTRLDEYFGAMRAVVLAAQGLRRDGSAALDLASVACGRFDGFWEVGLSRWDLSAGVLLVREAGGTVSGFPDGPDALESGDVIATNGSIQTELADLLGGHFAAGSGDAAPGP